MSISCCLSSLASAFHSIGYNRSVTALANHIELSLKLQTNVFRNRIHFTNEIMTNKLCFKSQQHLRCNLRIWNEKGAFDTLNDISWNVTLLNLMYTLGNVNHDISILRYCIFDYNYEKSLCLTMVHGNLVWSPSVGEEQVAKFETVFCAVRFI